MLRAIRRPKSSGSPSAESNGATVIACAPATAAAKQPTVARSRFDPRIAPGQGGRGGDRVLALATAACSGAPHSSATRSHSRRAARSLAIEAHWSALTA